MNDEGRLNILNEENKENNETSVIVLSHFKGHAMAGFGGASLIQRMESRNEIHTLEYGAQIGLGNLNYEIVNIDAR